MSKLKDDLFMSSPDVSLRTGKYNDLSRAVSRTTKAMTVMTAGNNIDSRLSHLPSI